MSSDIFVLSEGGKGGQTELCRIQAKGTLQTLWNKSNVTGMSWYGITLKGDSMAINAELPGGGIGSYLISTRTGEGRQMLGKNDQVRDSSRDGRWLAYWAGTATLGLAVVDMKDGSTRRLTKSPESEVAYWWSSDNNTIVFARQSQRRRIATVDLRGVLTTR